MCLIVWNWQPHGDTPLVLLSNRDEFRAREALPMHWWTSQGAPAATDILAGKDLQAGGTWLGISGSGRLAAITNFRSGIPPRADARSRGELVTGFLHGTLAAADYVHALQPHCAAYNPFNLLVFDGERLMGLESRHGRIVALKPGWGGVSNGDFNAPWPKLVRLQQQAQALPNTADRATWHDHALQLLQNRTVAAPEDLPQTGIPSVRELELSPIFIDLPNYGTRASSVVTLGKHIHCTEQVYANSGAAIPPQRWVFDRARVV